MRLLSSEAKDWRSRVVTEAEEVLCRESAQMAQNDTETQEAMDQHFKAKWQKAESDLKAVCQSNSAQVQSFASKMHETNVEHQQLHDAQERRIQLEAQALRAAHLQEQEAAHTAQEYQRMVQELRQSADEQPDKEKNLWKRHLSQQADYRAEIHELHAELLNTRERSEMKAHLAANMCRIEQTVPSRTVDAEPENTLNTLSPGRSSRWILPHELETPDRPTSSGLQSPVGVPVQFGPSPVTREYSATPPAHVPPAQWGEVYGRGSDDGCELFGTAPEAEESDELCPQVAVPQLDELQNAHSPIAPLPQVPVIAARCVNGNLLRPSNAEEELPSTALQQSEVRAPGGVQLGRGTPGQSPGPGGRRGRDVHPPLPPPATPTSSACQCSSKCSVISNAVDTSAHQTKGSRKRRSIRRPPQSRRWQQHSMEQSRQQSVRRRHWIRRRHWVRRSEPATATSPTRRKSRRRFRIESNAKRNSTPADRRRSRSSRVYSTYTSRHCTTTTIFRSMEST